jgi:Uma2 family endonuclease
MSPALAQRLLTEAEYLDRESRADFKSEYVAGDVFAMAGASERHNRIAGNIFFHLRAASRGKTCRAFLADMRLRVDLGPSYYYPDVMLVCDPADTEPLHKSRPCFIAEVLSPATAAIDLREKWLAYKSIDSLRHYLVADSERMAVRLYARNDGGWQAHEVGADEIMQFACGDTRLGLSLIDIYEDTGLVRY